MSLFFRCVGLGGAVEGVDEGADDGVGCGGRGLGRDRDPLPPGGGCGGCAYGHDPGCGGRRPEERGEGARAWEEAVRTAAS